MIEIKLIQTEDLIDIRHKMLRQGKPREACYFSEDNLPSTFHLGAFVNSELASIATFVKNNSPIFPSQNQFQLRGMATLSEFSGRGLGAKIIDFALLEIHKKSGDLLWCNARTNALGFYQKIGFKTHADEFLIPDVGPHYLMSKSI